MGKAIISGGAVMTAPSIDVLLSEITEGSIVKLNENGSPVEFYVAKHDYESDLNGSGRTLLVRKDCYDTRKWHGSTVNAYASSAINSWLVNTYKALLDADVQEAIGTTTFYYTMGNGNSAKTTLSRAVFLLSVAELGITPSSGNVEGTALPIADMLKVAYLSGAAQSQWTRTPVYGASAYVYYFGSDGSAKTTSPASTSGSRPAFTLPATAVVQDDGTIKI